jgi:two-component system invasion response regulator UvrY
MADTILIVDDHDSVRQALSRWLEAVFHNCLILTAATGEEALDIARDTPPQVIVMDFGLPGMNGAEATRRIKEIAPAVQVVILTIHDSAAYRTDADEAGVSAYVLKDDMQTQLVPTLKALLAGG